MGKPKKGSRGVVGQISSPRGRLHLDAHKEDVSKQDEPVTDTVMQVLSRRIRAARKKMQKVSMIESLLEQGQNLQEDQDRIYMMKGPLTAVIEELTKLEPLVEAALTNELAEFKRKFEEEARQPEAGPSQEAISQSIPTDEEVASEDDEDDGDDDDGSTPEGKSDAEEAPETDVQQQETSSVMQKITPEHPNAFESILEVLYFSQLLTGDQFDTTHFSNENEEEDDDEQITKEELQLLVEYAKQAFPTNSHTPKDGVQVSRDLAAELASKASPEAEKVLGVLNKLKDSRFYTEELRQVLVESPLPVQVETSEAPVDASSELEAHESEVKTTMDTVSPQVITENTPVATTVFPVPQYSLPIGSEPSATLKAPRPFLPFPGMAMTTSAPPVGLVMTQPPHIMGLHPYFSIASVPGPYLQPPPPPPYYAPPQVPPAPSQSLPTADSQTPDDAPKETTITEMKVESNEVKEEEDWTETQPLVEEKQPTGSGMPLRPPVGEMLGHERSSTWRGRGRYGRGRGGGGGGGHQNPNQMNRRPPHRPPFMQPRDQTNTGGRAAYVARPKYRRNA
eukprot:g7899.t1